MKFDDSHLAVFICSHVFKNERDVNLVSHEEDGDWQLMCGMADHGPKDGHVVGIGHLIERDHSLQEMADLPAGWEAERQEIGKPWLRNKISVDR